ncbi:hypothetical protein U1Q18_013446 [Sarracenia purpurea var. burkii]
MRSSNPHSKLAGDMVFNSDAKRCLRPKETSKVVNQKILSPKTNQVPKFQNAHNRESPFGQSYLDWHHESRRRSSDGLVIQPESSKSSQKPWTGTKAKKNNELVKHMSHLPGYLQREEKGENLQEKALNFGVLDWKQLEKWKYKKRTPPSGKTMASSSETINSFKVGGSLTSSSTMQNKQCPSHCSHLNPSHKEDSFNDVKQSRGKAIQQDYETVSRNTVDGKKPKRINKSSGSGRNHSEVMPERGKREGSDQKITSEKITSLPVLRKHEFTDPSKDETSVQNNVVTKKIEGLQASECYFGEKHFSCEHISIACLPPKYSPKERCSEIVQISEPGLPSDGKLREANWESLSDGFSSEEVHSAELYSEILHSCPLPFGVETSTDSGMRTHSLTHAQSLGLSTDDASYTFSCSNGTPAKLSQDKCINENVSSVKNPSENGIDASKRSDLKTTEPDAAKERHSSPSFRFSFSLGRISRSLSFKDTSSCATVKSGPVTSEGSGCLSSEKVCPAEFFPEILTTCQFPLGMETIKSDLNMELSYKGSCMFMCPNESPNTTSRGNAISVSKQLDQEATKAVKGRHLSPNRRFSFGLGRMSRSFSFREGSTAPQLSSIYASIKCSSMRSEASDSLDNIRSRARSSPLRRLLDPLLKGKVANRPFSVETIGSLTGSLNLTTKDIGSGDYIQDKKHETSMIQAFLQLTIKNGLPLFKLVSNNKRDILIAMKNLFASGKDDSGWIYTFYSVCEIKKKSGSWIHQGNKGNSYGFGYNPVGQMKFFSSQYQDLTVRESVLYSSVDLRQAELMANKELAAIVIKLPVEDSSDDGDQTSKGEELIEKGFVEFSQEENRKSFRKGETEKLISTTVILPGGVHGIPNKGDPSPLIERWKSGGSCDCGGWDIGCKVRILSNNSQSWKVPGPSLSFPNPNHFDLFNQGGAGDSRPVFSLALFEKGIYSVEFSSSISLLQAFSVCISVICSQKSFDFSDPKFSDEPSLTGCGGTKTLARVGGEVAGKCVPPPPPSPVGRV